MSAHHHLAKMVEDVEMAEIVLLAIAWRELQVCLRTAHFIIFFPLVTYYVPQN